MMNRRKAREGAFVLLFQYKFQPEDIQALLEEYLAEHEVGAQADYIREVVLGTVEHLGRIDKTIEDYAKSWDMDRISAVSLTAMRLAIYEMLYVDSIPSAVSVNEAVALAKEFEGEEAAPFVNGILGRLKETC